MATAAGIVVIILIVLAFMSIKVVREYERVVIFRLGKVRPPRGPGLVIVIPIIERPVRVNLQVVTFDVTPQDIITKDNITVRVDAVVYFKVIDPVKAVVAIRDYAFATQRIAQTTLRATLGQHELDELLAQRDRINTQLQIQIDASTEPWGIQVVTVETKDIDLPETMQRAMARQAEAERERRAKVIAAEGEFQAAERLAQAADLITASPGALQLRTLQTLAEVATEKNSTLVFPIPIELLDAIQAARPAPGRRT
jgi:regulator of protease activity HflC (stomatin/prohibitin superfamily)